MADRCASCTTMLHDVGAPLGAWKHPDVAAAIVKRFVSAETWLVARHASFQGYAFFHAFAVPERSLYGGDIA